MLKNRKSVLALVEQVDSKPVAPSQSTDYLALQTGFEFTPEFEELENSELKNSIGMAKRVIGSESPTYSGSHYLRHSGVEAQAPDFGLLLKSLLGDSVIAAMEYSTQAGTTAEQIQLGVAEASNFHVGQALLVKDSVNGRSIRNVLSVDTDNDILELANPLSVAPADDTDLGRAVSYRAQSEGHPSLSIWGYRANGGAVELISDAKVSELSVEVAAGQLINGAYSLSGIEYFFNPIEIVEDEEWLDFTDGVAEVNVKLKTGFYKDPHDLAEAVTQLLRDAGSTDITVTYDDQGKFQFVSEGATFDLLLSTGANAAESAWSAFGFNDTSSDLNGALTYESELELSYEAPQSPEFDSAEPVVAKHNEVIIGDKSDSECFAARSLTCTIANELARQPNLCAPTGFKGQENTSRTVTIDVVSTLKKHEAKNFERFRKNMNVQFMFNAGERAGGEWKAGKCLNMFSPTMTISSLALAEDSEIVTLNMTLMAYVQKGQEEFFVNFL